MNKADYEKAAEIVKPYQIRIYSILNDLRDDMSKTFGDAFSLSSFNAYLIPLFYDTSENATDCGFEFNFHDDGSGDFYEKCFENGIGIAICDVSKAISEDGDEDV